MKNVFLISSIIIAMALGLFTGVLCKRSPKTAFVELNAVYNDFSMRKEKETELNKIQAVRKNILDSLELQLNVLSRSIQGLYSSGKKTDTEQIQLYDQMQQEYLKKKDSFEQQNMVTAQKYDQEIWKQLDQYIKDYGITQGYTYIWGADGSGVLMHADESMNITAEVKKYVNERYKGAGK